MKRIARIVVGWLFVAAAACTAQPLASWNDGPAKQAIVKFVRAVTTPAVATYVAADERIAVFDNDGTLWPEMPMPAQAAFALDRVRALAPQHAEWKEQEPFRSVLAGDVAHALQGEAAVAALIAATHAGMTTDEFDAQVREWIATARHPRFRRSYVDLAYQPMLEVLAYLREHGFRTFIVSGGGVDFMRAWAQRVYGIPPEQVIGSEGKLRFEVRDGVPVLTKLPQVDLFDDKGGKPVGIQKRVGRRPLAAFGNSDGDREMLQWTTSGAGPRLAVLIHHTDAEREFAYDREAGLAAFDKAWDEAQAKGWIVVDMKRDWKRVFAFE